MENRQSQVLVALSVLLTLLVLAIVFVEPPESPPEEGRSWSRAFPQLDEESVRAIRVAMDGREAVIERRAGGWQWTAPVRASADATEVTSLISSMLYLDVGPPLSELKPEAVGLDAQAPIVELSTDADSVMLRVGDDAPVGSSTYVQLGDGPVRASRTRTSAVLPPTLDALRSRAFLSFSRSEVSRIRIESPSPGPALHIDRQDDGDWLANTQPRLRADRVQVDALVDALRYAEADRFLDDAPPLSTGWRATVTHADDATEELRLSEGADGTWRASGPRQPGQGVLAASDLPELLARPQSAWVDRHLLTLRYTQLDRLEVVLDGRSIDTRRTPDGWDDPRAEAVLVAIEAGSASRDPVLPLPSGAETGVIVAHEGDRRTSLHLYQELGDGGRSAREDGTDAPVSILPGTLTALRDALASD